MSFLDDACSLHRLDEPEDIVGVTCGDKDLDDFFTNDCFAYENSCWVRHIATNSTKIQMT